MNKEGNIFDFNGDSENNPGSGGGYQQPHDDVLDKLIPTILLPKPFGSLWPMNLMAEFLKARGYKIITRTDDSTGNEYRVAFKADDEYIPDQGVGNINVVFVEEVQKVLLKWLIKIGKENDRTE